MNFSMIPEYLARVGLICLLLAGCIPISATPRPAGLPADTNPGSLRVLELGGEQPEEPLELPLAHTDVSIEVSGFVARAEVTQRYTNPYDAPIEAVYTFPLPHEAAVDAMQMRIGERTIKGIIKRRDEARDIYEQAKQKGQHASLLEQERPNIFTQSVANIMPGDEIEVVIRYVDILNYADGAYELVFPMVVGPRYIPGSPKDTSQGSGTAPATDAVPDASRITPPVLKPGQRSGHDIALQVALDAGVPIQGLHSVSHAIDVERGSPSRRQIRLHPSDTLPNKDFILRYQVAGKAPAFAVIPHHDARGGFFTLIAQPPRQVTANEIVPRELIFILDTSGSMRGAPLARSKQAMQRLIGGMRGSDVFNVVRFAGDTGTLWPTPRPLNAANRQAALDYVEALRGSGGTEMRTGIRDALAQPAAEGRLRIAFLLTDGYVGDEARILKAIAESRRGARVFSLGVGSSVNRYLLTRAAEVGRGEAFFVRQDEQADAVIDTFFKRVDRPTLAHIHIDWGKLDVSDQYPEHIPDLWAGQPLRLHARYQQGGRETIKITGQLGQQQYEHNLPVHLPRDHTANAAIASVWARHKIRELMDRMVREGRTETLIEQVTEVGLQFNLMTRWTSFVAVEERVVNQDGEATTVVQPVELPEGVDYDGVFGERNAAPAGMRSAATASPRLLMQPRRTMSATPQGQALAGTFEDTTKTAPPPQAPATEAQAIQANNCRIEALAVSGALRYLAVKEVLDQALTDLCRPYHELRQDQPDLAGAYQIQLWSNAAGEVRKLRLTGRNISQRQLKQALRAQLEALHFAGAGRIEFTLVLATP